MARTLITQDQLADGILTSQLADGAEFVQRDGSVTMTGALNMGSQVINAVASPSVGTDAANKDYVDNKAKGLVIKSSVRVATTAPITLSGTQTIDGVSLSVSDRVLVKDQAAGETNGIYVVSAGAWSRSDDADASAEVVAGMTMFVSEGTTNGNEQWVLTTDDPIVLNTTALVFTQLGGGGLAYIGGAGMVLSTDTFNVQTASSDRIVVNADNIDLGQPTIGGSGAGSGFTKVSVDVYGRVTNTGTATPGDIGAEPALGYTPIDNAKFIWNEAVSGTVNGSNTAFSIVSAPVAGKLLLTVNGVIQRSGAGNDYTISGTAITMLYAPKTNSVLLATYLAA